MKQSLSIVLLFFSVSFGLSQFPGCPDIDAGADQTLSCPGICTTLTAAPIVSGLTTSYTVSAVDYAPPIAYNAPGGTPISVATDDVWSPMIQLPFNFCYYGQTYTSCKVGSNGAIKLGPAPGFDFHPWDFSSQVPSPVLNDAGNIFGVYHDIDPSVPVAGGGGQVRWYLLGAAPCRIFVVSFYEMAHFSCNNLRSTHMMVLYETTNVIDVYVEKKQTCNAWNNGNAVIGIQNNNGNQGIAAPGRNTAPWTVNVPEAWRFSPAGTPTYTVTWLQGTQVISNNLSVEVCPNVNTTYTASVTYTPCAGGNPVTVTDEVTVNVNQGIVPTFAPVTSTYCTGSTIPNFPSTSQNGITGSWSPAINNQQTTTYTFTPNPNQCASPVQTTITITPIQIPSFPNFGPFCLGDNIPPLPLTSNNGFQGNWTPALNNQQTTNYTFVPNAGQCASSTQTTLQVIPIESPVFSQVGPFCAGDAIPPLPTTSINAISGFWSPTINNQLTTTYTFMPNSGACATGAVQMTVEVIPNTTPNFAQFEVFCAGDVIPPLPITSLNNISGVWSPAINNLQTTNYTFTATDSGCFTNAAMTIEVLPIAESTTAISYCENDLPYFWNGLTINNNGSYQAFFLGANGCDSIATLQFEVIPELESVTVLNICENEIPFTWNGLTITEDDSYNVILTSSLGCDSTAFLMAFVRPIPAVDFLASVIEGCGSVTTNFSVSSTDSYVDSYWTFSDGTNSNAYGAVSKTFNTPGCYDVSLRLTTEFGCQNVSSKFEVVCVFPNPTTAFVASSYTLNAFNQTCDFINLSVNADTYFWDFDHNNATSAATNPSYTYPETPGQYNVWLVAENDFGCVDSTNQMIAVIVEPIYYVPNAFTPDGDAFNNVFLPVFTSGFDPFSYKLLIFNRSIDFQSLG
jgi:PKD repeat protein